MTVLTHSKPLIFAIIFMCGSMGVLLALQYALTKQGAELREQISIIENQSVFQNQFITLTSSISETETDRQRLASFVLQDEADTIALLTRFDEIALAQGVELSTRSLVEEKTNGTFNHLQLSYKINGREVAVKKMIEIMEALPYHGHVTRAIFSRAAADEVTVSLDLQLSIENYD